MGIRELRQKYAPNSCAAVVIARAVIAEIPGGEQAYQLKDELFKAAQNNPKFKPYYVAAVAVVDEMRTAIAKKYNLKSVQNEEENAAK